jgi:hypothetical protein
VQRIVSFLFGCIVGGIIATAALKYHVVRADDGLHVVPKAQAQFAHAYVDIRQFGFDQWQAHPDVALALARAGKMELLGDAAQQSLRQSADQLWRELNR